MLLAIMLAATAAHALGQQVGREQEITDLRLGQRMLVDDGSCPAGQIKEVSGAKMTPTGVVRARKCIPARLCRADVSSQARTCIAMSAARSW